MPPPVVTGISPKDGPPGTRVTIRGEFLGKKQSDIIGKPTVCYHSLLFIFLRNSF